MSAVPDTAKLIEALEFARSQLCLLADAARPISPDIAQGADETANRIADVLREAVLVRSALAEAMAKRPADVDKAVRIAADALIEAYFAPILTKLIFDASASPAAPEVSA